jgi:histidyl-tRNA synthetase
VFEFWSQKDGAQNATGGGGRYDGLVEMMGGQPTPAIGYAAGLERTVEYMKEAGVRPPNKDSIHVFVAQLGLVAKKRSLSLISELRDRGIHTVGATGKGSISSQMKVADRLKASHCLILGQIEVQDRTIILRDMKKGSQETLPYDGIVDVVAEKIGENKLESKTLWEE